MSEALCQAAARPGQPGPDHRGGWRLSDPSALTMLEHLQHLLVALKAELSSLRGPERKKLSNSQCALAADKQEQPQRTPGSLLSYHRPPTPPRFGTGCALISSGFVALPVAPVQTVLLYRTRLHRQDPALGR